jgi:NAD(P)-dependent dehydrogenase (short-subunit alcohol dehydrogenase family)
MALALAERGYDVAVHYAGSDAEAEGVVDEIRALGRNAVALRADLLVEAETQTLLPRASEALGGSITVLVNNASIFERDTIVDATRTSWDRAFETNLRAPFVLTQAFAAQVPDPVPDANAEPVAQGLVLNMIDQRVRKLTPDFISYTLAKSALWTLTQIGAQALESRVRVNAIGPGPTLQGERQTGEQFRRQREATILQRGADETDIVAALEYLLNARAVTGQMICVDGGQHLAWRTPDVLGVE